VLELAGIHDILSKSLGTQNPINLVKATVAGLRGLRTPEEVGRLRGLSINQVLGLGGAPTNGAQELAQAETETPATVDAGASAVAETPAPDADAAAAVVDGASA
jgi:small subunit ribosomal protein S5